MCLCVCVSACVRARFAHTRHTQHFDTRTHGHTHTNTDPHQSEQQCPPWWSRVVRLAVCRVGRRPSATAALTMCTCLFDHSRSFTRSRSKGHISPAFPNKRKRGGKRCDYNSITILMTFPPPSHSRQRSWEQGNVTRLYSVCGCRCVSM